MARITKLNVKEFARLQALIWAGFGLLAGLIYAFGGFVLDLLVSVHWLESEQTQGLGLGTILAFGAILGMPLLFGLVGFLFGVLQALMFNLLARLFGGLEIHLY